MSLILRYGFSTVGLLLMEYINFCKKWVKGACLVAIRKGQMSKFSMTYSFIV